MYLNTTFLNVNKESQLVETRPHFVVLHCICSYLPQVKTTVIIICTFLEEKFHTCSYTSAL